MKQLFVFRTVTFSCPPLRSVVFDPFLLFCGAGFDCFVIARELGLTCTSDFWRPFWLIPARSQGTGGPDTSP